MANKRINELPNESAPAATDRIAIDGATTRSAELGAGLSALASGNALPIAQGGTGATSASAARAGLGVAIGSDVQAYDADLSAIAGIATNGVVALTGAGTAAARTITGSAGRVSVTNGDGVSGNPTVDWDGVQVRKNSAGSTFTRRRINLIEGSNVTLTVADDAGGDEVDVTVTANTGAGKVLQCLEYVDTTNRSTTSTSNTNTTILLAITPSSTSNKVRITAGVNAGASGSLIGRFTIYRGSTDLTPAGVDSLAAYRPTTGDETSGTQNITFAITDSPATTSSTTYEIVWRTTAGTLYLGRRGSDTSIDTVSGWIRVEEITP